MSCRTCLHRSAGVCGVLGMKRFEPSDIEFRDAKARSALAHGDMSSRHVVVLCDGYAVKYARISSGHRQIVSYRRPGHFLLGIDGLATVPSCLLQALTDVRLAFIARERLMALVGSNPDVRSGLFDVLAMEERELADLVVDLGLRDAVQRVCHLLLKLIDWNNVTVKDNATVLAVTMRQEHIADFLGLTTAHVNRTLAILRSESILEFTGAVLKINDVQYLRERLM